MGTNFRDAHNRGMKRLSMMFDTFITISYIKANVTKAYTVKCTVNSVSDAELASGKYNVDTRDFTLRYDDIKESVEVTTLVKGCPMRNFKDKNIIYEGAKYSVDAENPNGSTRDCVVLRCKLVQ